MKHWNVTDVISSEDFVDKIIQIFSDHPYAQKFRFSHHLEPLEIKCKIISLNTKTKTSDSILRCVLKVHTVKPLYSGHHQDISSSVIKQKSESQNECFEKAKHAKISEKQTFLTP